MSQADEKLIFWEQHSADIPGILLNSEGMEFDVEERAEILSYLPDASGKRVLDLAAGIGRFTSQFAPVAEHVVSVDFIEKFIAASKETNAAFSNITYYAQSALEVNFEKESFDLVFINWLFMYLEDAETRLLADRVYQWLKPNGHLFVRESCVSSSNPDNPHPHSHYRAPSFYPALFREHFVTVSHGNVKVYAQRYGNPNQLWWLLQKSGPECKRA